MPLLKKAVRRLLHYGVWRSVRYLAYELDDAYRFARLGLIGAMRETRIFVPQEDSGLPNGDYTPHQPTTSFYSFRSVMDRHVNPTQSDVFLDYGSGLGRVLMMASTYPFCRAIGVEYSAELNARATRIVERAKPGLRCRDIQLVTSDAMLYDVPLDVTVIYFYNPFAASIMRPVCEKIRQSLARRPRKLRVVCFRPRVFEESVAGADWIAKKAEVRFPAISVDSFAVFKCE